MGAVGFFSKNSLDNKLSKSMFGRSSDSKFSKVEVVTQTETKYKSLPNPKPDNYKILMWQSVGHNLVIMIKYLDCTNYEGKKVLVFENCTLNKLQKQKLIDPHFSENKKFFSPIARFEPTERGWGHAIEFAKSILSK